jgi:hypothetical protein
VDYASIGALALFVLILIYGNYSKKAQNKTMNAFHEVRRQSEIMAEREFKVKEKKNV